MKEARGPVGFSDTVWIAAPLERVWQLVTKGAWLNRYFTAGPSGNLDAKGTVVLSWGRESEAVDVLSAKWGKATTFRWRAFKVPYATRVSIRLQKKGRLVKVTLAEKGWKRDPKGVASALQHAIGWSHFLTFLKAYAMYQIELRG